nr:immunoglobulin light chain junction region [Macaca mulatta]MOW15876.1 immunoglobulin light chain junction region [Macaca mulatta]MOW16375.1 immunoglobulin light chain junction region [Macaca mulatta]MOW17053.1 immunoglobulin light chain junction region [Macaca mulatta]MOW17255.1 immunoglobulin light chain junction region [Macaca mulatta]
DYYCSSYTRSNTFIF